MTPAARVIALVGAESTGKTVLSRALASALAARGWGPVAVVAESLREWCDREGRTPRRDEQRAIAREQHRRIDAAAASHRLVIADTTALMTAVYSLSVFGDDSLVAEAVRAHRRVDATLVTALDLDWIADGLQRSGEHVREPVQRLVVGLLDAHGLPWQEVRGHGPARLASALAALAAAGLTAPSATAAGDPRRA